MSSVKCPYRANASSSSQWRLVSLSNWSPISRLSRLELSTSHFSSNLETTMLTPSLLFTSIRVAELELPHRIVMAPMTRARSTQPGDIPNVMNARYYAQRASAALIVTEASQVSPQGKGYSFTPGIYSNEQVAGWRLVNDAVHAK